MAPLDDLSSDIAMHRELVILSLYLLNANTQYQVKTGKYSMLKAKLFLLFIAQHSKYSFNIYIQLLFFFDRPNVTKKFECWDIFWN